MKGIVHCVNSTVSVYVTFVSYGGTDMSSSLVTRFRGMWVISQGRQVRTYPRNSATRNSNSTVTLSRIRIPNSSGYTVRFPLVRSGVVVNGDTLLHLHFDV